MSFILLVVVRAKVIVKVKVIVILIVIVVVTTKVAKLVIVSCTRNTKIVNTSIRNHRVHSNRNSVGICISRNSNSTSSCYSDFFCTA